MQRFLPLFNALLLCFFTLYGNTECLYDLAKDFAFNCTKNYPVPQHVQRERAAEFSGRKLFGYPIASPIGIPACAIMTSNGIAWAAKSGYDILTYKTVRSLSFDGHPLPCIQILRNPDPAEFPVSTFTVVSSEDVFCTDSMTMANSMGNPSLSLEWALKDIAQARLSLSEGQVLIVSIMGGATEERSLEQDFAFLAESVVEAGAHAVEANLSAPNLHSPLVTYKDPIAVYRIGKATCDAVPSTPVILKVGIYDSYHQMKEVFKAAASAGVKGICGINAIPMQILNADGTYAFGDERKIAGVSGEFIRAQALEFILQARRIIQEEQLDLTLLSTGGILKPEQFDLFLNAGADIALSATGAMWNPRLAAEFHLRKDP